MKSVLAKYPKLKIYYVMVGGLSLICSVLLLYATNAMSTLTAHITTNGLINISIYIYKVLLLFLCFHFVDHVLFRKMKSMVQQYLHQQVYCQLSDGLNRQKLNDFNESGDLYALIQSDAEDSISFLSDTFIDIIYQLIRLAMVLVYIFTLQIFNCLVFTFYQQLYQFLFKRNSLQVFLKQMKIQNKKKLQ